MILLPLTIVMLFVVPAVLKRFMKAAAIHSNFLDNSEGTARRPRGGLRREPAESKREQRAAACGLLGGPPCASAI
jgi:hypothetical protein